MNKMKKYLLIIVTVAIIIIGACFFFQYRNAHTFTLTDLEAEEIQPILGTIRVSGTQDTDVWFIDVENPEKRYQIGYITPGMSETISLEQGKWYKVEAAGDITVTMVNVRIE